MIVFDLACELGHCFEGWFGSADGFEVQRDAGSLTCPVCASATIRKTPSAPKIARGALSTQSEKEAEALRRLRGLLGTQFQNVGAQFAEEARRIHYGEASARPIRGTATLAQAQGLAEEGIGCVPIPESMDPDHNPN